MITIGDRLLVIDLAQFKTIRLQDNSSVKLCMEDGSCITLGFDNMQRANDMYNKIKMQVYNLIGEVTTNEHYGADLQPS